MAVLVDTNVLVYRFDPRDPRKQRIAIDLLRRGIGEDSVRIAHQAIVEFVAAVSLVLPDGPPLLALDDARREAEELLSQFTVLWPNEVIVRTALRGAAAYQLSWFDAHMWAYAEYYGLTELLSEDFPRTAASTAPSGWAIRLHSGAAVHAGLRADRLAPRTERACGRPEFGQSARKAVALTRQRKVATS